MFHKTNSKIEKRKSKIDKYKYYYAHYSVGDEDINLILTFSENRTDSDNNCTLYIGKIHCQASDTKERIKKIINYIKYKEGKNFLIDVLDLDEIDILKYDTNTKEFTFIEDINTEQSISENIRKYISEQFKICDISIDLFSIKYKIDENKSISFSVNFDIELIDFVKKCFNTIFSQLLEKPIDSPPNAPPSLRKPPIQQPNNFYKQDVDIVKKDITHDIEERARLGILRKIDDGYRINTSHKHVKTERERRIQRPQFLPEKMNYVNPNYDIPNVKKVKSPTGDYDPKKNLPKPLSDKTGSMSSVLVIPKTDSPVKIQPPKKPIYKPNKQKSSNIFGGKKESTMFGVEPKNPNKKQKGDKKYRAPKIGKKSNFMLGMSYIDSVDFCEWCGAKKKSIISKCPKCGRY